MSKKRRLALFYFLMLSIILLVAGDLELVVRAFVSASTENYVLLASVAVLAAILPAYFTLHRPLAVAAIDPQFSHPLRRMASERMDRRRPPLQGQERFTIATERRGKQRAAHLVVSHAPSASGGV